MVRARWWASWLCLAVGMLSAVTCNQIAGIEPGMLREAGADAGDGGMGGGSSSQQCPDDLTCMATITKGGVPCNKSAYGYLISCVHFLCINECAELVDGRPMNAHCYGCTVKNCFG